MTITFKSAAISALLLSSAAFLPSAASAQVAGIATADQTIAIAKSKALSAAYTQIASTFGSNLNLIATRSRELNELRKSLDTNKDNQLDQAELDAAQKAKNPALTTIDAKESELNQLQEPVVKAQIYAVEQIASKYAAAQQQVITAKKISMILAPDAFLWAPDAIDVTPAIIAALDVAAPSVSTTAPADWRPLRTSVGIHQQIDQLLSAARQQQAQAAPAAAQPGKPAAPAPTTPKPQPESR